MPMTQFPEAVRAGALITELAGRLHACFQGDCRAIAAALQWPASAVRTLMRGGMSARWRLIFASSKLALALGQTRDAVAEEMARAFIPSPCVIGRALVHAIASRGLALPVVLKQLALSEAALNRLLLGRSLLGLSAATHAGLASFLGLPVERIQQLIQESLTRRRMPTREMELIGPVCSLAEALHEAFDREGINQTEWVKRHHFSNHWIRSLVIGHQPRTPQRSLVHLAEVLGLQERQVLAGLRLNQPFPPPPHRAVFAHIARREGGDDLAVLARAFAMTRPGVERLCARQDLSRTSSRTLHRIRRWLGLSWREFVALAAVPMRTPTAELRCATSFTPVDQGELVMIRLWRKATVATRALALQALHAHADDARRPGRPSAGAPLGEGAHAHDRLADAADDPASPQPVCELLFDALECAHETPTRWGRRHHLSLGPTRALLMGEQVPLGAAILEKIAAALGLSVEAARHAVAANRPLPPPPHQAVFALLARRIAGRPRQLVAREMAIARSSYDRMVDLGDLRRLSGTTIHRVRRWLGWSWEDLVRHAALADDGSTEDASAHAALPAGEREDEEELALIRSWRRAAAAEQEQALDLLSRAAI